MTKKESKTPNPFGTPGAFAVARNQVGGDWAAAALLFRLKWRWRMEKKLTRLGREWIAMSRKDWAQEAGLSEGEMKNRALPKLRKCGFVRIRAMKLGSVKLLWMHLDEVELSNWLNDWDTHTAVLNGHMPFGYEKPPGNYPYKKTSIFD